jgi:hypothetical protein
MKVLLILVVMICSSEQRRLVRETESQANESDNQTIQSTALENFSLLDDLEKFLNHLGIPTWKPRPKTPPSDLFGYAGKWGQLRASNS